MNEQNIYFTKIKRLIPREIKQFEKVYFIGGFKYDKNEYETFASLIQNGEFLDFLKTNCIDINFDNVEVYYLESEKYNEYRLLTLIDYQDLFFSEEVLDYHKIDKLEIQDSFEIINN